MLITVFIGTYGQTRLVGNDCLRNYQKRLAGLERFHGEPLRVRHLRSTLVDAYLASRLRAGRSPYYVHSLRASILAVWSAAHRMRLSKHVPRAMTVRRPDLIVRCWSPEDVAALIEAAASDVGMFATLGCSRGLYLSTAIAATWHSGLRRGDLHRLRHDQIRSDGTFEVLQHKTGRRHVAQVPPQVLTAARSIAGPPGPVWPRPGTDEVIRFRFRRLVESVRRERPAMVAGDWRDIRRSAENTAERLYPGRGHLLAGHERRTFEKYYKESSYVPEVSPAVLPGVNQVFSVPAAGSRINP